MPRTTTWFAAVCVTLTLGALTGCPGGLGQPQLSVSRVAFIFNTTVTVDAFTVGNTGGGTLEWSIDPADIPVWLDLSRTEGSISTTNQVVTMSLSDEADGLPVGLFQATLTIESNGGSRDIAVTFRKTEVGDLVVEPTELDFGATISALFLSIRNNGADTLAWNIESITPEGEWLRIVAGSPTSGTLNGDTASVEVGVDRAGLAPDEYVGEILIDSNAGQVSVAVTMIVPESFGMLSVAPDSLEFETNGIDDTTIAIRNSGNDTISWSVVNDLPAWLSVSMLSGTVTGEIDRPTVQVNASSLAPGVFTHTITIESEDDDGEDAGTEFVDVMLTVPDPVPVLDVTPTDIDLGEFGNGEFFTISNGGNGQLDWSLTVDAPWIILEAGDPTMGSLTTGNQIIDFTIDRAQLSPGVAQGTVSISSNGGDATVFIRAEVLPPTLAVTPLVLNFSTTVTQKLTAIFNAGTGTVNWNIDTSGFPDWLRNSSNAPLITQTSGSVSGTDTDGVTISVNRVGQLPGDFTFAIPVTSNAGNATIQVLMRVSESPVLSVDTGRDTDGAPNIDLDSVPFIPVGVAPSAMFTITNTGTGTLNLSIDDAGFPDWLSLTELGPLGLDEGQSVQITARVERGELPFGPFEHTFFISSNDNANPQQPVRVEMSVPKKVEIGALPQELDFGTTGTTDLMEIVNLGDPDTVLNFGITTNKPWLFAFPQQGRSIGVENPFINGDFQPINVSIDRTGLDGSGGGSATITVFAQELVADANDVDGDGNRTELVLLRNDNIAAPKEIPVSVQASELFFEVPPARLRVPSLVRYIMMMRNLRFNSIPLPDDLLPFFEDNFFIFESDQLIEQAETNQFLTSAQNLDTNLVILLDYSASAVESAALAQQFHDDMEGQLGVLFPQVTFPTFPGFTAAADPLQFIYEQSIGSLLEELPDTYRIALMEFHDRDQGSRLVADFTLNDPAGKAALIAALDTINVTAPGATELLPAILGANAMLVAEDQPLPSTGPVIPRTAFDDADVRGIIVVSDGRLTTPPGSIPETVNLLRADRTQLWAVAWGKDFNAGPMATMAAETGGHLYVTREINTGFTNSNGQPLRAPSIQTLFDWCNTDFTLDQCDLSISEDLKSQVVLSYVTLNESDSTEGRVGVAFDDPNDGGAEPCALPDQGEIAGEFVQELLVGDVVGIDALGLGTQLGQVALKTPGLVGGMAEVFMYVDYMPRDIVGLELVFAAEMDGVAQGVFDISSALVDVTGVPFTEDGVFENDWTVQMTGSGIDGVTGLNTVTYEVNTSGDTMQYGLFGRLVRVELAAGSAFDFRLLEVNAIAQSNNPVFVHPDGIPVDAEEFEAPSFPTPRLEPTILDFGSASDTLFFTIQNVGGSFTPANIFLDWEILGGSAPAADITVTPDLGELVSTETVQTIKVELDRNTAEAGPINKSFILQYETGILGVQGLVPFVITGTILPPELAVEGGDLSGQTLDFGSGPADDTLQELVFEVHNEGQSQLLWFVANEIPAWMDVEAPFPVPGGEFQEVSVIVNRETLTPGTMVSHTLTLQGATLDGALVNATSVMVEVTVDP